MKTPLYQLEDFLKVFRKRKVLTRPEILEAVGCSWMTAWRLLRRHGYFTSYTDNARYYTLDGMPTFNAQGLWNYRGKRFSKWGSLTNTIIALVENSTAGMTAAQLEQQLGVTNVKPSLVRMTQEQRLAREKIGSCFVYFSETRTHRKKQRQQKTQQQVRTERSLPPLEQILALLVEIIQRPHNTPKQWARRLKQRGVPLGTRDIQMVMDHYGIDPKKGLLKS